MTLPHQNASTHGPGDRPRDTLTSYFARYRFALYFLAGAGLVAGIALSGSSVAVAKLLPILLFLPCIVMMFMCMKRGNQTPDGPAVEPIKMLSFQSGKPPDPKQ
jgi:hypothetical protein